MVAGTGPTTGVPWASACCSPPRRRLGERGALSVGIPASASLQLPQPRSHGSNVGGNALSVLFLPLCAKTRPTRKPAIRAGAKPPYLTALERPAKDPRPNTRKEYRHQGCPAKNMWHGSSARLRLTESPRLSRFGRRFRAPSLSVRCVITLGDCREAPTSRGEVGRHGWRPRRNNRVAIGGKCRLAHVVHPLYEEKFALIGCPHL